MRKILFMLALVCFAPLLVAQTSMDNDSVIKLCKSGLSDDVIVATINSSSGNYKTTADDLVALKTAGASDKVVAALVTRANAPAVAPAADVAVASKIPAGIDEVGVYYKDKSGTWVALMPEIVNFKTGGVMKSFATHGIVKGDLNGHIQGKNAKTVQAFPITLAVYVPEGTAITEYQLLRFRPSGSSREFRSVTGGVFHTSGGASRDSVEFSPEKIAPRLYQIKLESSLGKGEYGLLPPGAVGSSNMGSSGKVYSISIPE
jgi:hypothetical protein